MNKIKKKTNQLTPLDTKPSRLTILQTKKHTNIQFLKQTNENIKTEDL